MSNLQLFSTTTIEALKHYVYALVNPIDNKIFYIGKGQGNRVFDHQNAVIKNFNNEEISSLKINIIKEIIKQNKQVISYVIRHGLTEKEALELEATLIDVLSYDKFNLLSLTNAVSGHNSSDVGIHSTKYIEDEYSAEPINKEDFKHNILILNIGRTYFEGITDSELYEATRKSWDVSPANAEKVDYIIARSNGILREIYEPINNTWNWQEYPRISAKKEVGFAFEGKVVKDVNIRNLYLNKFLKGNQNPINYIFAY